MNSSKNILSPYSSIFHLLNNHLLFEYLGPVSKLVPKAISVFRRFMLLGLLPSLQTIHVHVLSYPT